MIRLLARTAATVIVLSLTLTAARAVGALIKSPALDIMAANGCDPHPCWQGIRPGQISMTQADTLVRANNAMVTSSDTDQLCWNSLSAPFWTSCVRSWNNQTWVDRIEVRAPPDGIALGDALLLFGVPITMEYCPVINSSRGGLPGRFIATFITFKDNTWLMAYNVTEPQARRLDPHMLVLHMVYNAGPAAGAPLLHWRGFTNFDDKRGTCNPQ